MFVYAFHQLAAAMITVASDGTFAGTITVDRCNDPVPPLSCMNRTNGTPPLGAGGIIYHELPGYMKQELHQQYYPKL
jgi:hypothetical protein